MDTNAYQTKGPRSPDLHTDPASKVAPPSSFGLSSHPQTHPAAAIRKRGVFIYKLGRGWAFRLLREEECPPGQGGGLAERARTDSSDRAHWLNISMHNPIFSVTI